MVLTIMALSMMASADPLVILHGSDSKTDTLIQKVGPSAEYITWADLQEFPLAFSGITEHKTCLGNPASLEDLRSSLKSAESSVAYLETQNALGHVRQIENKLPCLTEAIPTDVLVRSNYIAGVAYNYDSKTDQAKAAWRKALMYNPNLSWDDNIEPSGKGAFDELKRTIQNQATTSLVLLPANAKLTVDGNQVSNGDSLIAGEHFVQHNKMAFQGHSITTEMGSDSFIISFADFPNDLTATMSEQANRQALLKGVLLFQDKSDIRIVTSTDYWYLQMGTTKWKSESLEAKPVATAVPEPSTAANAPLPQAPVENQPALKINKPVFLSGIGLLAAGGGAFLVAQNQAKLFDSTAAEQGNEDTINAAYRLNHTMFWTGTALSAVGGGLLIKGSFAF